jgi:Icc-related predicted phosphoesterase|tara:strand:- start:2919 stop:3563 length:645 start_codon:yes stop_codon:yes gene_type:complete
MKILAFTDFHADEKIISKILKKIKTEDPELLICTGDFTVFGKNLVKIMSKFLVGKPLVFIPGNHEDNEKSLYVFAKKPGALSVHQTAIVVGGILFVGSGGGIYGKTEPTLDISKKLLALKIKNFKKNHPKGKVVFLTHRPAYGTKCDFMPDIKEHVGATNITEFIEKNPIDLHICGHIHECFNTRDKIGKTITLNPGPDGTIINVSNKITISKK